MKLFRSILCLLIAVSLCGTVNTAVAATGCSLNNPEEDLGRFFPEFSDFTVQYLSFAQQDPKAHQELSRRMGGKIDAVYETPDVPYTLYTVNQKGSRVGYVFGTNQRGTYSNIQVIVATDAHLRLLAVYLQKIRSPDYRLFLDEAFGQALREVPLDSYPEYADCFDEGLCSKTPIADPTKGRQAQDFHAILRALAKLSHLKELLLKPGTAPKAKDDAARGEQIATQWVPEKGFRPLDRPTKVSVNQASEHVAGPQALVAAFPGREDVIIYPLSLLTLHPVIQDDIHGEEATISWSSPSHTLSVLRSEGTPTLRFSNTTHTLYGHQTMLERKSRSEWSPILGQGLVGDASGALTHVPGAIVLPWAQAQLIFPQAQVAIPDDPYSKHKEIYQAHRDRFDRPGQRERILLISNGPHQLALPTTPREKIHIETHSLGAEQVLVVQDRGAQAVYSTQVDGQHLTFSVFGKDLIRGFTLLRDSETGSIWQGVTGLAVRGPRMGTRLRPVVVQEMPAHTHQALFPTN